MNNKQNLHIHTTYADGKDKPEEMIRTAMGAFYVAPQTACDIADAYLSNELGSGWEWWHNFMNSISWPLMSRRPSIMRNIKPTALK